MAARSAGSTEASKPSLPVPSASTGPGPLRAPPLRTPEAAGPRDIRCDIFGIHHADVAELVDAHGSGPCGGNSVEVRVLSSAPIDPGLNQDPQFSGGLGRSGAVWRGRGCLSR